jgi:hypothetical protein
MLCNNVPYLSLDQPLGPKLFHCGRGGSFQQMIHRFFRNARGLRSRSVAVGLGLSQGGPWFTNVCDPLL